MRHLASVAGVTPATISMALANHPRISKSTRERIQTLAEDLGYVPNPYVSALMRMRRQGNAEDQHAVIAAVNVYSQKDGWENHNSPTVRQMRLGVIEQAAKRGYLLEEFWLNEPGMKASRLSDILSARGIRGIVLSPLPDHMSVPEMKWDHFSAVAVTVPQPGVPITTVCSDHYFSMLQTMRECYRLGYRRPGLVLGKHLITRFHGRWQAGYLISRQLLEGMDPFEPYCIEHEDRHTETDRETLRFEGLEEWLDTYRPDLIVTTAAEQLQKKLAELGIRVPEDIGLAWTGCPDMGHPISGIYQNGRRIGAEALDAVTAMVERNDHGLPSQASSIMVEGEWNPGQTLRAIS